MTTTDEPCGLLIEADLTVDLPNSVVELHSEHDTLYVEAESFAALRELRATAHSDAVGWLRHCGVDTSLRIETPILVRVRGVPVARYRPSHPPGRLADRLGISPLRVEFGGLLQAAWRRLRGD